MLREETGVPVALVDPSQAVGPCGLDWPSIPLLRTDPDGPKALETPRFPEVVTGAEGRWIRRPAKRWECEHPGHGRARIRLTKRVGRSFSGNHETVA